MSSPWPVTLLPHVSRDGPTLMIPPPTAHFQVLPREALTPKPQALDQSLGGDVVRLNVCLQPMEAQTRKRSGENRLEPIAHEPLASMTRVRVEAKIGRLEGAAHHLADVHDAHDLARVAPPAHVRDDFPTPTPPEIPRPSLTSPRGVDPGAMQVPARTCQLQQLGHV